MVKDGKVVTSKLTGEDPRAKSVARRVLWLGGDINWAWLLDSVHAPSLSNSTNDSYTDTCIIN